MGEKSVAGIIIVITLATSSIALYERAVPGGTFDLLLLVMGSWLAVGVVWLMLIFTRWRSRLLAVPPVLVVATYVLVWTGLPLWVGFQVSKSDLAHHAATGEPGRAGMYQVGKPVDGEGPIRLPVRNAGFVFTECGFLYAPAGLPDHYLADRVESIEYGHVEGPWYWYQIQQS